MDHLTHDVDIGEPLPHLGQYPRPERRWHGVGRVQAPAVGARGEPVAHHGDDVLGDGGLVVVERHQHVVALERRPAAVVGTPEPRRLRAARLGRHEGRELPPDVVEHPVEQHPQATVVRGGGQRPEVGFVTEPRVDAEVVGGVVAVRARREHRPQRDTGRTELHGVVEPVDDPTEPVGERDSDAVALRADEAQREDVPPDRVFHPVRFHGPTLSALAGG